VENTLLNVQNSVVLKYNTKYPNTNPSHTSVGIHPVSRPLKQDENIWRLHQLQHGNLFVETSVLFWSTQD